METLNAEQRRDLALINQEAAALTSKHPFTKQDEIRFGYLKMAAASIRSGASLQDIERENHNEYERRNGLEITNFGRSALTREQLTEARAYQAFFKHAPKTVVEFRDMTEGAPMLSQIGTYSSLGYFVPTGFMQTLFAAMKKHDALFDDDVATVIRTSHGRVINVTTAGDTENAASVVGEAGSQTSVDIDATGHAPLAVYSYNTRRYVLSLEAIDDLEASFTAAQLFGRFSADALARGIGRDLVTGDGTNKPLGLVPALIALGVTPVTCSGAAGNTGGAETGANSIGTADFALAYQALDAAYLGSDKCRWLMNLNTLGKLMQIVDKYGRPIINFVTGAPTILGIPIAICPSMDNIGASAHPVVLGDCSFWATRLTVDDLTGLKIYKDAPGLVEQGNFGLRSFVRAGGALLYTDTSSPCPFVLMQNHS